MSSTPSDPTAQMHTFTPFQEHDLQIGAPPTLIDPLADGSPGYC